MRFYLLLTVCALIVGAAIATSGGPAQDHSAPGKQQKADWAEFESQFPLTDVNKPEPSDRNKHARWQAKGKKYKRVGLPITESSGLITYNTEWDIGLPALPVSKSDLVVMGAVIDAQAYVSKDKNWVYSEFTIRVDEVLKNTSNITLAQGSSLVADRDGGGVRFPSGRIVIQHIVGQGMPRVGRRYALFLTCDDQEQNIQVLTAYELRGGQVFPIDNPAGGQHPIATAYKNADEVSFLSDLRAAIANPQ
jgi:hypothetical protein